MTKLGVHGLVVASIGTRETLDSGSRKRKKAAKRLKQQQQLSRPHIQHTFDMYSSIPASKQSLKTIDLKNEKSLEPKKSPSKAILKTYKEHLVVMPNADLLVRQPSSKASLP